MRSASRHHFLSIMLWNFSTFRTFSFFAGACFFLSLYSLVVPELLRKWIQCAIQMRYNDDDDDDDYYYVLVVWQSSNGFWLFGCLLGNAWMCASKAPIFPWFLLLSFEYSFVSMLSKKIPTQNRIEWIFYFPWRSIECTTFTGTLYAVCRHININIDTCGGLSFLLCDFVTHILHACHPTYKKASSFGWKKPCYIYLSCD